MLRDKGTDYLVANRTDTLGNVGRFEQLVARFVNRFPLIVSDIVVFKKVFAHIEIARLNLALRIFNRTRNPRVFDRLAVRHFQTLHDRGHTIRGKYTQQRVFQREIKTARTGVALTAGTAAQLVIYAPRLVTFGGDNMQAANGQHLVMQLLPFVLDVVDTLLLFRLVQRSIGMDFFDLGLGIPAQHNVGAATGHIGGNGDRFQTPGLHDNLRFARMLLGVKHVVRQFLLVEHL